MEERSANVKWLTLWLSEATLARQFLACAVSHDTHCSAMQRGLVPSLRQGTKAEGNLGQRQFMVNDYHGGKGMSHHDN